MPTPFRVTVSGSAGISATYYADYYKRAPFAIGVGCVISTASTGATYNVEHTFDPIAFPIFGSSVGTVASSLATWFQNSGITAASCNKDGNYAFPVTGIRLNVTSASSQGTVTMTLIQAGI